MSRAYDEMFLIATQVLLTEGRSALQHFSVNDFGDTLFPRQECIDTDVKIF